MVVPLSSPPTIPGVYYDIGYRPMRDMNRIKQLREAKDWSQEHLGELMGTSDATVNRLENSKRELKEKWIRAAARALGVSASEILGDIIPPSTEGLVVMGEIQAGVWRETFEDEQSKYPPLPIGRDPRYPNAGQYALKVIGNSMDKVFPEGQFIVCAVWADVGRNVRHNDLVVVHRFDAAGKTESTVKRAKLTKGKMQLWPESTNPKWQLPIEFPTHEGADNEEVIIKGLVIGRYEPL